MKYELLRVNFWGYPLEESTRELYYRSTSMLCRSYGDSGAYHLQKKSYYDFFTYFNALSIEKWKTYTRAEKFSFECEVKGKFMLCIFGHWMERGEIKKEWLASYRFDLKEKTKITVPIGGEVRSQVVGFQIKTISGVDISNACYVTELCAEEIRPVNVAMTTTTFGKEAYIERNAALLNQNIFFDPILREHFYWNIIDNGGTLDKKLENEKITIIKNPNTGGAGGFCRGMLEAWKNREHATHALLMDDDVEFSAESFRRLYRLLAIIREEYRDSFICGAMLEMEEKTVQHEDIGFLSPAGEHGPVKPRYNMAKWDSVCRNEQPVHKDRLQYSGWWYCCMPIGTCHENNLPMPFFIRGDDVEYAIRNRAKLITMNGICIWHQGFTDKFSGALELYQVHRNDLIIKALHPETVHAEILERIWELFWQEVYKFNYKGANLLLDAVEDYLKGPEFIADLDGEQMMKDKKAADNVLVPVPADIRTRIKPEQLYVWEPLGRIRKFIYDYSCNGQKRIPAVIGRNKSGIIPYGWGYYQKKMCLVKKIYAVTPDGTKCAVYEYSRDTFKQVCARFERISREYDERNRKVQEEYRSKASYMTGRKFWENCLGVAGKNTGKGTE